jgi:4-hydroxythreonine-4-phosphate dehydrogenase
MLAQRACALGLQVELRDYVAGERIEHDAGRLSVLHQPLAVPTVAGQLDRANAAAVLTMIDRAVDGCLSGEFGAMVTAPVHKALINEAGFPFTGHTEYIAQRTLAPMPVMMLLAGTMRVALATTHLPLRAVSAALSTPGLLQILEILASELRRYWGMGHARIAVCGLNPHAGEGGHLGDEEQRIIGPAVLQARSLGLAVDGPLPADTLFVPSHLASYDVVLAMYHDQGLPVLKHAGFGEAVNVTLGLPIVRTSVDHGTALDRAGRGNAEHGSLVAAIELAAQMAPQRP